MEFLINRASTKDSHQERPQPCEGAYQVGTEWVGGDCFMPVYGIKIDTLSELISFLESIGGRLILYQGEDGQPPTMTIYDEYSE